MADLEITVVTEIEGLDALEEALTQGSKRMAKKFLRRVEMKASAVLMQSAKEYAPYITGQLETDIHRQSVYGDGSLTVRVGPGRDGFYAIFTEFGAPEHNVAAEHWLENSARAVQDAVLQAYIDAVNDGLNEMKR